MTKTFKFYTKDNNNNNGIFLGNKPTNYSEILDNIIATNIVKKNKYLFNTTKNYDELIDSLIDDNPIILTGSTLKASDEFTKAATFLANYKKYTNKFKLPYILGKMYTLSDGTPIVFYDDEVQIGFDVYKYSNFTDISFLKNLTTTTKKIIINIYTTGAANININLL